MNLKEKLMQKLRRLFGRKAPATPEPSIPTVHPNDDVRESIASLCQQIEKAHEEKKSRSIRLQPPVGNGHAR